MFEIDLVNRTIKKISVSNKLPDNVTLFICFDSARIKLIQILQSDIQNIKNLTIDDVSQLSLL